MKYNNLKFYDSDSNELNLELINGIFQGVVYLPLVSTGLYETLTLHILEKVKGTLGQTMYVRPIAESDDTTRFDFEFESNYGDSEDIFLYSTQPKNGDLYIQTDNIQSETILDKSNISEIDSDGCKVVSSNLKPIPVLAKIALKSEVDNFHIRTLNVYEKTATSRTKIAAIKIYGEVEAEDERLKTLLSNIGMSLETGDFYIFKSSNIQEGSPDFTILNEKRKELLLQASQIKPFIGTYKALLNAINFFGYDKITLKEYWLNINEQSENFGKLQAVAVPNQTEIGFLADKNKSKNLPNSNQKKTSRFSLIYRINKPINEFDQWDIPKVEEVLDFSPDEVLIKLFGLKRKLQRDFLPLHAKIIDITGEGDYFSQFNQNIWNNQHSIKNQQAGIEFDFELIPNGRNIFIEDLRKVDYRLTGINQDFNQLNDKTDIIQSIKTFYENYYNKNLDTFNTISGIPIGAPIILDLTDLNDTWDDAEFTWMDAEDTGNDHLGWSNWWYRNVYEVEWVVRGPRNYFKAFRGHISDYKTFPLVLPYNGFYTIDANLYDLYNVKSTKTKKDFVEVKNKNVEIYALSQFAGNKLNWNEYRYNWNNVGSSWEWGRENITEVDDTIATLYLTMDRANYINDIRNGVEFSTVRRYLDSTQPCGFNETPGPYQWSELTTHVWNDGPEVTWDMTRVGADINSSFKIELLGTSGNGILEITQIDINNQIITDSYQIQNTYPSNNQDLIAWRKIARELNNLNPIEHPILSKFNYNDILEDTQPGGSGPQGEDTCEFILAVAKKPSRNYDFNTVKITQGIISEAIHFTSYNPDFNDTYIINSQAKLHMLNHLTFSYDLTNIPGIESQQWKLINNTLNIDDIYYNNQWLTYLFKHKGNYTVELELTDKNGNKNKTTKNILNII